MRTLFIMHFMKSHSLAVDDKQRPHVTFLGHMRVPDDADLSDFLQRTRRLVEQIQPFSLTVGESKIFGADGSKPAFELIDNHHAAARLHALLAHSAERFGYQFERPEHMISNFNPHISKPSGLYMSLGEGDEVLIDSLLVSEHRGELFADVRTLAEYSLTGTTRLDWH